MEDEKLEVLVSVESEKEKEFKFSKGFKWLLGFSIFLTGLISIPSIFFTINDIGTQNWNRYGITIFLYQSLLTVSLFMGFCMLVSIARAKRPFSKILIKTAKSLAWLFFIAAIIFPRFPGYMCRFQLYGSGSFILGDGSLLMIGMLIMIFAKLMEYGFKYQNDFDATV